MVGVKSHSRHQLKIGTKLGDIELQEHLRISDEMPIITLEIGDKGGKHEPSSQHIDHNTGNQRDAQYLLS